MNKTKSFPGNAKKNDRNSANKQNTHTLRNKAVETVSMDENIWHTLFFRTIPLSTPPFLCKKSDTLFGEYYKNSIPSPVYKGGGSLMVAGLKCLKIMQFQGIFFCFKGLKLPHKMIRKSMQAQNSIDNCWFNCKLIVNSFVVNS